MEGLIKIQFYNWLYAFKLRDTIVDSLIFIIFGSLTYFAFWSIAWQQSFKKKRKNKK